MFPQAHRATVIGVCNILARAATILAPLVNELPEPQPMVCLMALAAIAFVNSFFLSVQEESAEIISRSVPNTAERRTEYLTGTGERIGEGKNSEEGQQNI